MLRELWAFLKRVLLHVFILRFTMDPIFAFFTLESPARTKQGMPHRVTVQVQILTSAFKNEIGWAWHTWTCKGPITKWTFEGFITWNRWSGHLSTHPRSTSLLSWRFSLCVRSGPVRSGPTHGVPYMKLRTLVPLTKLASTTPVPGSIWKRLAERQDF